MINVGILTAPKIKIKLYGSWVSSYPITGKSTIILDCPARFFPISEDAEFALSDVTIGIDYHWQRKEEQIFTGLLYVKYNGDLLTAINTLPLEDYLVSVISSEMNPTAHIEFLKAAAVISRSWAIKQMEHHASDKHTKDPTTPHHADGDTETLITWQDHQDHTLFDVCADDHCQRYQGVGRITHPNAQLAVKQTYHQVLTYKGEVCDCRFSKCCGGITEEYPTCWEDTDVPYLKSVADVAPDDGHVFCDAHNTEVLSQVLNNYDQETTDFYRWTVTLTQQRLQQLLHKKLGHDFGEIKRLTPLKIGPSGRIFQLLIEGTQDSLIIGKELTIRSALSESHLYSSAFTIETTDVSPEGIPRQFILHGKGWGHGVGLCQIGAAVMANEGYTYKQILQHYYPGTTLTTIKDNLL